MTQHITLTDEMDLIPLGFLRLQRDFYDPFGNRKTSFSGKSLINTLCEIKLRHQIQTK